ncbi:MAG: hypothetical protein NVS4B8_02640 [Herpetosiphon sp.]
MTAINKVVAIFGAGRGIGRSVAAAFAPDGAHVVLRGPNLDAFVPAADGLRHSGGKMTIETWDVTDEQDVARFAATAAVVTGSLESVISNFGHAIVKLCDQIQRKEWEATLCVTLAAAFLLCNHVLTYLITSILAVAIDTELCDSIPPHGHYSGLLPDSDLAQVFVQLSHEPAHVAVTGNIVGHQGGTQ